MRPFALKGDSLEVCVCLFCTNNVSPRDWFLEPNSAQRPTKAFHSQGFSESPVLVACEFKGFYSPDIIRFVSRKENWHRHRVLLILKQSLSWHSFHPPKGSVFLEPSLSPWTTSLQVKQANLKLACCKPKWDVFIKSLPSELRGSQRG